MVVRASVPPPPTNQQVGVKEVLYSDLHEADCRYCHENPDQFPVEDEAIPDRHHLFYGLSIPEDSMVS